MIILAIVLAFVLGVFVQAAPWRKPEPDWRAIAYRQHLMALVHGAKQCDTESCTQWLREFEEANRG